MIQNNRKNTAPRSFLDAWDVATLAFLLAFYLIVRVYLARHFAFFDPDEALEMLVAQTLGRGELPYVDAYTHRGPFLTLVYALGLEIGGEFSFFGVQLVVLALFPFTLTFFYGAVRRLFGRQAAQLSAGFVVLLSTLAFPSADIWALNSDYLLALWATLGMSVILLGAAAGTTRPAASPLWALGGLLLSLGFLTKQNGIFFAFAPLVLFASHGLRAFLTSSLVYGIGFLFPCVLVAGLFLFIGEWERFWYLFYEYNSNYATISVATTFTDRFMLFAWVLDKHWLLLLPPLAALVLLISTRRDELKPGVPAFLVLAWVITALITAAAPGRPWENYLWATIFPFSLVAGASTALLWNTFYDRRNKIAGSRFAMVALIVYGLCFVPVLRTASWQLRMLRYDEPYRVGGIPAPQVMSRQDLISLIDTNSTPDDFIYVSGYAPEIYVLARRRPASRHLVSNFIETYYPGSELQTELNPSLLDELFSDLDQKRPRIIVDAGTLGYLAPENSDLQPALLEYVKKRGYRPLSNGVYLRD